MAAKVVELRAEAPECRIFVDVFEDHLKLVCATDRGKQEIRLPIDALPELEKLIAAAKAAHSVAAVRPKDEPPQQKPPAFAEIRRKHPRAYEPWTREEDTRLLLASRRGETIAQIANELKRQPGAIRSRLEKLNSAA